MGLFSRWIAGVYSSGLVRRRILFSNTLAELYTGAYSGSKSLNFYCFTFASHMEELKPGDRIRLFLKKFVDTIRNEKLKSNLLQALPFWIASLITGLIAVLYSKLFAGAEGVTSWFIHYHKWWLFLASPCLFALSLFVIKKFAPYAQGSGIPQVMAAIELANPKDNYKASKLLSIKVIVVKIISSLFLAMGGGAIGREGPTIQIAGSVFRKINQWVPASWPKISRRNMIMTGAAAGLAAAFNTPLGGIVFAVEELTRTHIRYYRTAIFSAVIIAGLTAQYYLGPYLYLGYPDVHNLSSTIFLWVALVAIITGLLGSVMCSAILFILNWKKSFSQIQTWAFVIVCSVIMTSLALTVSTQVLGSGKELMNTVLFSADKHIAWYIPLLRFIGPLFSFTTGAAGGVFAPALGAGASCGALIAQWFNLSPTDTNLLILSGMVGFLTGVTRTPFTSAILVLEMTDRHNVIFHLMLAGMLASVFSIIVDKHSFYDHLKLDYMKRLEREDSVPAQDTGKTLIAAP
jgi:H+/Cl- antiporter ClcA